MALDLTAASAPKVLQVLPKPSLMFGVLSFIERFLLENFVLLAEFGRAGC
jgi:hypothetical protein